MPTLKSVLVFLAAVFLDPAVAQLSVEDHPWDDRSQHKTGPAPAYWPLITVLRMCNAEGLCYLEGGPDCYQIGGDTVYCQVPPAEGQQTKTFRVFSFFPELEAAETPAAKFSSPAF